MEDESQGLYDQFLHLLEQLILPNWSDLMRLVPWVFVVLLLVALVYLGLLWRRAGRRNQPRVPPPRAAGAPPPGIHLPGPSRWPFVLPIGAAMLLFAIIPRVGEGGAGGLLQPWLLLIGLIVVIVGIIGWLRDAMREWRTAASRPDTTTEPSSALVVQQPSLPALAAEAEHRPEPPPGVHLPAPSPWPFFAPIGIALVFFGLIFSPVLVIGGVVLGIVAAGGWLREAMGEWRGTEAVGHPVPATRDPVQVWPRRMVTLFSLVIALSVLVALGPQFQGWADSLAPAESTPTPLEVPEAPEITARNASSFETDQLVVPAGRDFELTFHNEEAGTPHNVEIADSPARTTVYLDGEIITGPQTVTYDVPALAEGDYYFLCKVHPNMNGTVLARTPSAEPRGSPPSAPGSPAAGPGSPDR
jgi:plastocyanin